MEAVDRVCFMGKRFAVGTFRCPTSHPSFHNSGPAQSYLIVFPRTSVTIRHVGKSTVVTDPNVVMFYNKGQEYQRGKVSEQGDYCEWYAFSEEAVVQALQEHDPTVQERGKRPFQFTHGPASSTLYVRQRMIFETLRRADLPDHLCIEEWLLTLLRQVIVQSYCLRYGRLPNCKPATLAAHKSIVQNAKAWLALHFREKPSLEQIAAAVHTSPYHLCRVFRQITCLTLHSYLNRLRLHASLEVVAQDDKTLTQLSHDLGYANHSHFTAAFRRAFGLSPTQFRRSASGQKIQQMSKILTVQ